MNDVTDEQLGIQRDYLDNADRPARLDYGTVDALRTALGLPDPGLDARAPLVVRPGARLDLDPSSVRAVELEDGSLRDLDASAPLDLPFGYHWLETGTGAKAGRRRLIVSPGNCVPVGERAWGWTAQLYATRSRASWGIGDLGDLARLTRLARYQGAGYVMVSPLHAGGSTSTSEPQEPSPYFPSTRRFLNPIYLAIEQIEGAADVVDVGRVAAAGRALNDDRRIDRDAVWRLKRGALRAVFQHTRAAHTVGLESWRRQRGEAVEQFATWCVLAERLGNDWTSWPDGARRPDGPLTRQVAREAAEDVSFVVWLQWQTEQQLRAAGRELRVLQDLPIGVDPHGADAWAYQDVIAEDVTVGAPPDPFNRAGQDWGLPPFVPWRLRAADYEPFVQAIRATAAHAGGLRIDHVMGLFRLWWVPKGMGAARGGYVRYPSRDLLDIVALESVRAGAPVVGEDLGTVEPGVREELAERNVLSYRLLWFEQDPPEQWPVHAMAAAETHDLPTVAGMWDGSDVADQRAAGLDADEEATSQLREMLVDRAGISASASPSEAVDAAYTLLARAPSVLLAATLEDALAEPLRPNMPGTTTRPNWSTALAVPLDELEAHPGVRSVARRLSTAVTATPDTGTSAAVHDADSTESAPVQQSEA